MSIKNFNPVKALFQKSPRWLLVLVGLAIFGIVRAPFEEHTRKKLVDSHLLLPPPAQDAIQQMSQSALMGTLGGLRTLVSSYLVLEAFEHFSNKEWEELRSAYAIVTSLEPRDENHWRDVVWHLGINATANMQLDETIPEFERKRRFNEYALLAVELAEQGIAQNPDSAVIRQQLAEVYREKLKDDCATARVYQDLVGLPEAPQYAERFAGYFLAKCPGHEQEAYDHLLRLYYEGEHNHVASLIITIKDLEKQLEIPRSLRITEPYPDLPGLTQP
ncbi:MAG: hypothetical protein P1U68_00615 [Verrucomicrobiales bacterium]|nr:hypothetical protein [Verrucomicrobiales bacterium]